MVIEYSKVEVNSGKEKSGEKINNNEEGRPKQEMGQK